MANLNKTMKALKTKGEKDKALDIPVIKIQNQYTIGKPKVLIVENLSVESSRKLDLSKNEETATPNKLQPQSPNNLIPKEIEPKIKSLDTIKSNKFVPIANKTVSFLAPPLPPTRFHQRSVTSEKQMLLR